MKTSLVTIPALTAALLLVVGSAHGVEFTKSELARLDSGKSVTKPLPTSRQNGFYGGTGWAIVDAPVEVVWEAIQDWESYPAIFPHTVAVRELSRKNDRLLVRLALGHRLVTCIYHVDVTRDPRKRMLSFRLVPSLPHDIEETRGYWRLFPQQDGRTLVAYVVAAKVPMGLINLMGAELERKLEWGILNLPINLKRWVEGPNGDRYRRRK